MRGVGQAALVALNRAAGDLQGQLYHALRARILGGGLPAGARLPSTRQLAVSLGVARATVVAAYERLLAEGYVVNAPGKASRVANIVPPAAPVLRPPVPSARGLALKPLPAQLEPGVPDLTLFPVALWGRLLASQARRMAPEQLGYGNIFGESALRAAILAHISVTRGVVAVPEQVALFPSTRAAMALIARVVLRGHVAGRPTVWMEDPAYANARRVFQAEGGCLVPVPVDSCGLDVERASGFPAPCLIYVTPSHQYPTGVTMSLSRRLRLLEVARQSGALILEDDYDSEFQFNGRPVAALQGIDQADCVAYLGTLSKVLAPGVRLAYAVLPRRLLVGVQQAVEVEGVSVSAHIQAAFLAFLREGHFGAHIKRMTAHYATRMAAFRQAVEQSCATSIVPGPGTGGLQLALWFKDRAIDDKSIVGLLRQRGYAPAPLSGMYEKDGCPGLLCGIASLPTDQAPAVARIIAGLVQG